MKLVAKCKIIPTFPPFLSGYESNVRRASAVNVNINMPVHGRLQAARFARIYTDE